MIITFDGPSGAGKGTIAKKIAKHYDLPYLDTGLLFRRLAYALLKEDLNPDCEKEVLQGLGKFDFNENVSVESLRAEEVSQAASKVSVYSFVRTEMIEAQRKFSNQNPKGVVMDGRDMGTVVFPQAEKKFFLTASPEVRAKRRFQDLKNQGQKVDFDQILQSIKDRDFRDQNRSIAPSKPAENAVIIDTSGLSIDAVFAQCVSFIEK